MRALSVITAVLAAGLLATPTRAEPPAQPPMNDFYEAFYTCESGAFLVSYDSDTPASATMTTSGKNKRYALKRTPAPTGIKFSSETAKFWTDGKTVAVEGTDSPLRNCKKTR